MKGLNKIVGGLLGFLFAGPGGCLLGILIGHVFDKQRALSASLRTHVDASIEMTTSLDDPAEETEAFQLEKAYRTLDIAENATFLEVRQTYRRMMNHYHPDKLAKQELSSDQLKEATQKAQHIKEAYEIICQSSTISKDPTS